MTKDFRRSGVCSARALAPLLAVSLAFTPARAQSPEELYSATAIVTGQGEANRLIGFRDCLGKMLAKVSGDQTVVAASGFPALLDRAGDLVAGFRYRDLLEGVPIHDEQGTYDRPHVLTCLYEPAVVDGLLHDLGRRAWGGRRPMVAIVLAVEQGGRSYLLSADGDENPAMEEAIAAAAGLVGVKVIVPARADFQRVGASPATVAAPEPKLFEAMAGADRALAGTLRWSDQELGWVARWTISDGGRTTSWGAAGVSFDDAFRDAMRGAAQVLSGNGQPPDAP